MEKICVCHFEYFLRGVIMEEQKEYEIEYAYGEMYKCNSNFPNTIGFKIEWGAKGIGFGELSFYYDTQTQKWEYDDEYMSADFCKAVLAKWFDSIGE